MHLASKSASSGRHKIHVRFYLTDDRFVLLGFWAVPMHSKRFRDLPGSGNFLGLRMVRRHPQGPWTPKSWKTLQKCVKMSICDKIIVFPWVFQYFHQKCCYFVRRMQKVLRHMAGVIEKTNEFLWFSCIFEILHSWCIEKTLKFDTYFNKSAPSHGWSYWKSHDFARVF